ncbi:Putative ABC-type permease protein (fragment) [Mesorhizobium sp. STM 4661]
MMLVLAVVCARFRDMTLIVQNLLQVTFYLTPVMWAAKTLPEGAPRYIIEFNPFFHLVSLVRDPLLGQMPEARSWEVAIVLALVGWLLAVVFFGRFRARVPYWL